MMAYDVSFLGLLVVGQSDIIDRYRKLDFTEKRGKFDDACKNRIEIEFQLIREGRIEPLRVALRDANRNVRGFAAAALGILGDRASTAQVADLAKSDPETLVRLMAIQGLGWLKAGGDLVAGLKSDSSADVRFMADVLDGHLKDSSDYAAAVRDAFKVSIKREEIATASVGKPAPSFKAMDHEGRPFDLAKVLKKKNIVLMFQLADW